MIVHSPIVIGTTTPSTTVATFSSLDFQTIVSVVLEGATVATSVWLFVVVNVNVDGFNVMLVQSILCSPGGIEGVD